MRPRRDASEAPIHLAVRVGRRGIGPRRFASQQRRGPGRNKLETDIARTRAIGHAVSGYRRQWAQAGPLTWSFGWAVRDSNPLPLARHATPRSSVQCTETRRATFATTSRLPLPLRRLTWTGDALWWRPNAASLVTCKSSSSPAPSPITASCPDDGYARRRELGMARRLKVTYLAPRVSVIATSSDAVRPVASVTVRRKVTTSVLSFGIAGKVTRVVGLRRSSITAAGPPTCVQS